jgi:diguanylate cyclase (GGDEF)-like protein
MIRLLRPDQIDRLRVLVDAVAAAPDFDSASRLLVEHVSTILDVPVALLVGRDSGWRVQATHGDAGDTNGDGPAGAGHVDAPLALEAAVAARPMGSDEPVSDLVVPGGGRWTQIALHDSGRYHVRLLLLGEWTLSAPMLEEWANRVSAAFERLPVALWRAAKRRMVTTHSFARRLSRITDPGQLHQTIADTFARAVRAEKSSLALFDRAHNLLTITATSGYAGVLVRHLRIRPGAGIIGTVYRSGRPLLVANVRALPEAPIPRLRYRTPSFISLPLVGANDVLGVMSVADRRDAQAFQRRDLNELRGLASIAALALERNDAVRAARASARLAAVDPVTGLFNRRQLYLRLDEEIERARRQQAPLTALMLDVDNFKQLNDRLGHQAGDAVLRVIGDVLRRSVRLFDVCARYGGDEFAVLMPDSGDDSSAQIAERIREGIEDSRPGGGPWSDEVRVTVSIGIASFLATTGEELLARADQALYLAKREGRNRVAVSTSGDTTS